MFIERITCTNKIPDQESKQVLKYTTVTNFKLLNVITRSQNPWSIAINTWKRWKRRSCKRLEKIEKVEQDKKLRREKEEEEKREKEEKEIGGRKEKESKKKDKY